MWLCSLKDAANRTLVDCCHHVSLILDQIGLTENLTTLWVMPNPERRGERVWEPLEKSYGPLVAAQLLFACLFTSWLRLNQSAYLLDFARFTLPALLRALHRLLLWPIGIELDLARCYRHRKGIKSTFPGLVPFETYLLPRPEFCASLCNLILDHSRVMKMLQS